MKTKASLWGGSEGESWWFFWMLFSRNASTDWWEIKRCLQHRAFWNVAEFELFGTWKGAGIPHKKCWEVHPYFFLQRGQKGQAEVAPLGLAANGFPKIPPFDGLFYLWNFEWFCLEYVCFNRYWMILFSSISRVGNVSKIPIKPPWPLIRALKIAVSTSWYVRVCHVESSKNIRNQYTLPETNSKFAPEHQWLEDDISFWDPAYFGGANC